MNFLYKIFISPIEMIVDTIFSFVINEMPQLGVFTAILFVSLCINFFALPLYNIADKLQEKERNTKKKLEYRIQKIKKAHKSLIYKWSPKPDSNRHGCSPNDFESFASTNSAIWGYSYLF